MELRHSLNDRVPASSCGTGPGIEFAHQMRREKRAVLPYTKEGESAMQYSDDRFHWRVAFDTKQCEIPRDELVRMQHSLAPLGEEVCNYSASDLAIRIIHHPRSNMYHVEARLRLPGQALFTGD